MTRYLMYSHDTYGLGHFRRSTLIASGLVGAGPHNEVLIVTGSPRAQSFRLPDRIDTIKLPTVTKNDAGSYRPRKLSGDIERIVAVRSGLIASSVAAYEPDVIVVDHAPLGMGGELQATLDLVEHLPRRPRTVLGLRDIIDDAGSVEAAWHREGVWGILDRYDDILVYGDLNVISTATELRLDGRARAPVTHTGYVAPAMPEPQRGEPFLLVTPGGGGDGIQLLRRFLEAAEAGATAGVRSLVVTGPLLSARRRAELLMRAEDLPTVEIVEFSDRMRWLISSAIGVVSMAGYNTVVEELAAKTPALLVPRRRPRMEQHIRANRLVPLSRLSQCRLDSLSPERVQHFITYCLNDTPAERSPIDLAGVGATVAALDPTIGWQPPASVSGGTNV